MIRMAKEAGFERLGHTDKDWVCYPEDIERFAALIASAEREACAKIVEESSLPDAYSQECMPDIANDIRARGQA